MPAPAGLPARPVATYPGAAQLMELARVGTATEEGLARGQGALARGRGHLSRRDTGQGRAVPVQHVCICPQRLPSARAAPKTGDAAMPHARQCHAHLSAPQARVKGRPWRSQRAAEASSGVVGWRSLGASCVQRRPGAGRCAARGHSTGTWKRSHNADTVHNGGIHGQRMRPWGVPVCMPCTTLYIPRTTTLSCRSTRHHRLRPLLRRCSMMRLGWPQQPGPRALPRVLLLVQAEAPAPSETASPSD